MKLASWCWVGPILVAGCGGAPGGVTFDRFQAAEVVIGQPDFTSAGIDQGGSPGAGTLGEPFGRPVVNGSTLYIADEDGNRVLGFDTVPTTNGASADFVIGQPDFTTAVPGTASDAFRYPGDLAISDGKLVLADANNDRVLIWDAVPTANVPAYAEVGQPTFASYVTAPSRTVLTRASSVAVAGGKLLVADGDSNRVMIWNEIPTSNGAPADVVVGQPDFTSSAAATTRTGMSFPLSVASDGTRLVVADAKNNRVLIWSAIPTEDGAPADVVVGQPNFLSSAPGAGAWGLHSPEGVLLDGDRLFVADSLNNRVLIYDTLPVVNQAPADQVLGQSDFEHVAANDDDQNGVPDATPSARTFDEPAAIYLSGRRLFVTDFNNDRVLLLTGH